MAYNDQVIQQVQSLNDIVEIISGYIPLKRAGRNFKACCPFHEEKSPSFMVSPDKQIFHCFGCGAGGDVFSFIMKYEQLNFPEAVRRLAERVHMPLPESTRMSQAEKTETERLFDMYAQTAKFYEQCFKHPELGRRVREYWQSRGFSDAEAQTFQIGCAPPDWKKLFDFLSSKGFKEQELLRSGLILRSSQGTYYDLFRNRLMFPIFNAQGKVIAFGGRGLDKEAIPKYLNSPESPIFRKRRELYGLHAAKRAMGSGDVRLALIVEGYLDCIRLHSAGFQNTVATLGTALTSEHVRILKRYADEAAVIYDGDKAGEQASLRGLDIFLEEGMPVKVVCLPQGFDPDDLIREKGSEEMKKLIEARQDFFDFKLGLLMRRFNKGDSLGLLKITSEFMESFARIQNPVLVDRYLKKLGAALGVEETSLRTELAKLKARQKPQELPSGAQPKQKAQPAASNASKEKEPPIETHLLSLMLHDLNLAARFQSEFSEYVFLGSNSREIFQLLSEMAEEAPKSSSANILSRMTSESLKTFAAKLIVLGEMPADERLRAFEDCLLKLKSERHSETLRELRRKIAFAEGRGDQDSVQELMKAYQELLTEKK